MRNTNKAKEKKIPNIQAPFIDHIVMKNSEIIVLIDENNYFIDKHSDSNCMIFYNRGESIILHKSFFSQCLVFAKY